jgi:Putative effector of murein hydrolase LrgA
LFQVPLLLGFWLVGEGIVRMGGLPIPGSIIGLFILLILLGSKQLSISSVQRGAQWFIAEMLLFFIPAVLAVLDHPELLGLLGLKILAAIVLGTLIVMVVTATVIDLCYRASVAGKGTLDGTN